MVLFNSRCFDLFRSSVVLLEFIYNLFNYNYNLLIVKIVKLQGYMKVTIEASPIRLSYVELTKKGSLLLSLIL